MAAKKKTIKVIVLKKDFKHYNKTFGNFFHGWEVLLSLLCFGIIRINALIRRLRKS
jgi:hypothetical protein